MSRHFDRGQKKLRARALTGLQRGSRRARKVIDLSVTGAETTQGSWTDISPVQDSVASQAVFSGRVWLSGVKFTGLNSDNTKPWVKINVTAGTVTQEEGPPSDPHPSTEVWREKSQTFGDFTVSRL